MRKQILGAIVFIGTAASAMVFGLSGPVVAMPSGQLAAAQLAEASKGSAPAYTEVRHKRRLYPRRGQRHGGHYRGHRRYNRHHHNGGGYWPGYGGSYWPGYGIGLGYGFGLGYGGFGNYYDEYETPYYNSGGSHVRWCLNRYRSYSPRSDTFMGYDGRRHYCRSPYR